MFEFPKKYDVIVVGGGHAGVEAALASARMGCQTLMLTMNLDSIGQMSCNPAIGGLAKGHLAREIDALGGEMGKAADMTGIQFRMLNTKKGPSVWAPRAQCDKKAYQFRLKWICEKQENLDCKQALTNNLIVKDGRVVGVETTLDVQFLGTTVIITTGTFLRGLMHIGSNQQMGGRAGESSATGISQSLLKLGVELGRLKTGTPPRLNRQSIDFARTEIQPGDDSIPYFSYWSDDLFHVEHSHVPIRVRPSSTCYPRGSILDINRGQIPCFITSTTPRTADLIKANLHKSPMYSGIIEGVGPRYCPSIEDKIVRFADKETHQIFLEPEGMATDEIYVNGFSTSLPYDVQVDLVRTIVGCERAEIMRPAYAVEYDFAFPTQLLLSLESKNCSHLFLAGQINGTSGYEEAAAQGIMAGINAARKVQNRDPVVLRRDQAYIGVLIDDLVTKGTLEPYRMFTSRAEYRLLLRQDNADSRLSQLGYELGLLPLRNYEKWVKKRIAIDMELERLQSVRDGSNTLYQLLKRPEYHYCDLPNYDPKLSREVYDQVEIEAKYAGYIARQEIEVSQFKRLERNLIPDSFDFGDVPSLRSEARLKLSQVRPKTIGQASRISGVSPADVAVLMVVLKKRDSSQTVEGL